MNSVIQTGLCWRVIMSQNEFYQSKMATINPHIVLKKERGYGHIASESPLKKRKSTHCGRMGVCGGAFPSWQLHMFPSPMFWVGSTVPKRERERARDGGRGSRAQRKEGGILVELVSTSVKHTRSQFPR